MTRSRILLTGLMTLVSTAAWAQQPAPDVDEVGQQAAGLEAELGKFKDSSPEAAAAMVKLADLYHRDGRLFGLVRVAQQFVASHPTDPRHAAMMLKLIDAQEGLSRNKDLCATIRQFISRYPTAAEAPALEIRLADSLQQQEDRLKSAEACRAVWQRHGASDIGRRYGVAAMQLFSAIGSPESITLAAVVGEEMVDRLPVGEFSKQVGAQTFYEDRRIGLWAKSTALGA